MNWHIRTLLVIIAASATLAVAPMARGQTYYPNDGDFWYNGCYYADSYLLWSNPGGWSLSGPGYEHDLVVQKNYFSACTSWTNLPNGYDDCPTAGYLETNPNYYAFSFGSFWVQNIIQPSTWYFGSWNFSGGSAPSTDFRLNGQEVAHDICAFDSPWCMDGRRSQPLLRGWLYWGWSYYNSW